MKTKKRSSVKKKANLKKSKRSLGRTHKVKEDFIARRLKFGSTRSRRNNGIKVIVPENETEMNIQECSVKNIDIHETKSESDKSCSSRPTRKAIRRRLFAKNREGVDSSDTCHTIDVLEGSSDKEVFSRSSRLTSKGRGIDKVPVYFLKSALIPLKDIGDLLEPYSKGKHANGWMFSIKRIKTPTLNRQSSSASDDTCSSVSLESDPSDAEVCSSELSSSDSEDSSTSWSIGSSLSARMKYISSSEEDSDSNSDELEEIEDDFILHTSKNRKTMYTLRKRNSAIRKKVAKYCKEQSDEESSGNSNE